MTLRTTLALCAGLSLSACAALAPPADPLAAEAERRQRLYIELVSRGATPEEARDALEAAYGRVALAEQVARVSLADSLLALPPDSLAEADARWLMVHLAEKDVANREVARARADRRYTRTWTIAATAGYVAGLWGIGLLIRALR